MRYKWTACVLTVSFLMLLIPAVLVKADTYGSITLSTELGQLIIVLGIGGFFPFSIIGSIIAVQTDDENYEKKLPFYWDGMDY